MHAYSSTYGNHIATIRFYRTNRDIPWMETNVSANTCIEDGRKRPLRVRVRSKAYRTGLIEGFGATNLFLEPRTYRHTTGIDASVSGSWKAVGSALRAATKVQRELYSGKATDREKNPAD